MLKKFKHFFILYLKQFQEKNQKKIERNKKKEIQIIVQQWIRRLHITFGWTHGLGKIVVDYVMFYFLSFHVMKKIYLLLLPACTIFMLDQFCSSSKLINTLTGHTNWVHSIDYLAFDDQQIICSASQDNTVRVWDIDNNKQIEFNRYSKCVACVKFSSYHYHNRQHVICSSSDDKVIRFWNFKSNIQLQTFNGHTNCVGEIKFSSFNGGRYLCSGSYDKTIRLWDVETSRSLHVFNGHEAG
ncbi:WD-repeat protein, partial [Reticulomyxa filosa]